MGCGERADSNHTLRLVTDKEYYATWVQLLTAAHCVRLGPSPLPYFPWGGAWATRYGNLSSIALEMIFFCKGALFRGKGGPPVLE